MYILPVAIGILDKGEKLMIQTKKDLKQYIEADQKYYRSYTFKRRIRLMLSNDHLYMIQKFMKFLRKEEFHFNHKGLWNRLAEYYYARRKNQLGNRLGFYVRPNSLGKGTTIFHHGTIIVHGDARLGEGCKFHGNNCIGNDGKTNEAPQIGNEVDIGFGAVVIGNVKIGNYVTVAAGAVVVSSFEEDNLVLAGVPAKVVKKG